jgi:hypothetical protein
MKKRLLVALATFSLMLGAHAQSNSTEPLVTPAGTLQFVRNGHEFQAMLDQQTLDRFDASTLTHFDDIDSHHDSVNRVLVQTDSGPVLYDLQRRPPLVQRANRRMTIKRVFWQDDEVVMQGSQGWFRFKHGEFSALQSSKSIYH